MTMPSDHAKLLTTAHQALAKRDYQQAHSLANQVLKENPRTADAFFIMALVLYLNGRVSVYSAILSLSLAIMALLLFGIGVLAQQGNMIQRELWMLKQEFWLDSQPEGDEAKADAETARES